MLGAYSLCPSRDAVGRAPLFAFVGRSSGRSSSNLVEEADGLRGLKGPRSLGGAEWAEEIDGAEWAEGGRGGPRGAEGAGF